MKYSGKVTEVRVYLVKYMIEASSLKEAQDKLACGDFESEISSSFEEIADLEVDEASVEEVTSEDKEI